MSAIEFATRLAGVPQETIDEIEKASPAAADLVRLIKDNQELIGKGAALIEEAKPLLDKAAALYLQASPLIERATPLFNKAWTDVQTILPAAADVLAFIKSQQPDPTQPVPGSQF